jgi:hypothetical protein
MSERPRNGDTKICLICGKTATFRDRQERPVSRATVDSAPRETDAVAAWRCDDPKCDYFEELQDQN